MQACFTLSSAPRNIDELVSLLKKCTPVNMRALKDCLVLASASKGDSLDFELFVDAIAYPIQSYKMSSSDKGELFLEIRRLYPTFPMLSGNKRDMAATRALNLILKRINPGQHPVALDALRPYPALELSQNYRTSLLGATTTLEGQSFVIVGMLSKVNRSPQERYSDLLPQLRGRSDKEMAAHYHLILNLLYLETVQLRKAWELVCAADVEQKFSSDHYAEVKEMVRLSMEVEKNVTSRNDESEEDFAFALQSKEIEKRVLAFLKSDDRNQHRALLDLYRILLTLPSGSEHSRVQSLLRFIKKEMAIHEYKNAYLSYVKFVQNYMSNSLLVEFCAEVTEDFIAPCNSALVSEMNSSMRESMVAISEYRVSQRGDPQHQVNIKELCKLYPTIAASQRDMYSHVYQLLQNLISRQKKRLPFMPYLKCVLPDLEPGDALPGQLPEVTLLSRDLSINMLRDFDQPVASDWPKVAGITKRVPSQSKRKKAEIGQQDDASIALSTLSLAEDTTVDIVEEDVKESPVALEVCQLVNLPPVPAPFVYAFRVFRWFEKAAIPLNAAVFPEYVTALETYQRLMVAYHAFTSSVDFFIIDMALKTVWPNPTTGHSDTRYILPAEISIPDLGKRARGVFSYCVGGDKRLYHRFFSEKSTEEIVKKVTYNSFKAVDFPSLSADPQLDRAEEYVPSTNPEEKIVKHPLLGTVTIENQRTRTKITLFSVTPEALEAAGKKENAHSISLQQGVN